jgi:hypothetical protein
VAAYRGLQSQLARLCASRNIPLPVGYAILICLVSVLLLVALSPLAAVCNDGWRSSSEPRTGPCAYHDAVWYWAAPVLSLVRLCAKASLAVILVWVVLTPTSRGALARCGGWVLALGAISMWPRTLLEKTTAREWRAGRSHATRRVPWNRDPPVP